MKYMNILITSIGQRGYLVDHFKESAKGEVGVYAADATKYAPALQNADKAFVIPLAKNPQYFNKLLKLCKRNNIKGIVSINDLELPILAKYKNEFLKNGIMAIISEPEVIDICFDKYKTYKFCLDNKIPVPLTYLYKQKERLLEDINAEVLKFPIIAKPRKGSRSLGIHLIYNLKQLLNEIERLESETIPEDEKLMFQEYLDSDQYSVHIFNDATLKPVAVIGMVNLFRHFGETFHIKTYRNKSLIELGIAIGEKLGHFGPLSADVHMRDNGEYVVLEFNPRFPGCYSLSHYAGADFPGKIYKLLKNEPIDCKKIDSFTDDLIMLKQFTTFQITESLIASSINEYEIFEG